MKKLNKKGFTLIELLAVIVILGILMIVAIPMVTRYIEQSRKDTFADSAKAYINSVRYALMNGDYATSADTKVLCSLNTGAKYSIVFGKNDSNIKVDKSSGKSSFGNQISENSYVLVNVEDDSTVTYSICMDDGVYTTGSGGGNTATAEANLKRGAIVKKTAACSVPTSDYTPCQYQTNGSDS